MQCQSWRCKCDAKVGAVNAVPIKVGTANAVPMLALQMTRNAVLLARNDVLATIFVVIQEVNATCRYSNDKMEYFTLLWNVICRPAGCVVSLLLEPFPRMKSVISQTSWVFSGFLL